MQESPNETASSAPFQNDWLIKCLLERHFPSAFSSVIVSSTSKTVLVVWLELAEGQNPPSAQAVEDLITRATELFQLPKPAIEYSERVELPSEPQILRALKICAPADAENLSRAFWSVPIAQREIHWLDKRLDSLRRRKFLTRSKTGHYSLTELGLFSVPRGRSRGNTDVLRALALTKKQW